MAISAGWDLLTVQGAAHLWSCPPPPDDLGQVTVLPFRGGDLVSMEASNLALRRPLRGLGGR